jgi:hypothetical protein
MFVARDVAHRKDGTYNDGRECVLLRRAMNSSLFVMTPVWVMPRPSPRSSARPFSRRQREIGGSFRNRNAVQNAPSQYQLQLGQATPVPVAFAAAFKRTALLNLRDTMTVSSCPGRRLGCCELPVQKPGWRKCGATKSCKRSGLLERRFWITSVSPTILELIGSDHSTDFMAPTRPAY